MTYVNDGDTLKVPAIRKGNSGAGYVLFKYQIFFSSAGGKTGTITLEFSDGSTQTINFTNYDGIITVVPKIGNNGQYGWYQAL